MVDDEIRRGADELRAMAARLRLLAQQTRSAEVRDGLLDLADRFDGMAGGIDGDDDPPPRTER